MKKKLFSVFLALALTMQYTTSSLVGVKATDEPTVTDAGDTEEKVEDPVEEETTEFTDEEKDTEEQESVDSDKKSEDETTAASEESKDVEDTSDKEEQEIEEKTNTTSTKSKARSATTSTAALTETEYTRTVNYKITVDPENYEKCGTIENLDKSEFSLNDIYSSSGSTKDANKEITITPKDGYDVIINKDIEFSDEFNNILSSIPSFIKNMVSKDTLLKNLVSVEEREEDTKLILSPTNFSNTSVLKTREFSFTISISIEFVEKTSTFTYDVGTGGNLYQLSNDNKVDKPSTVKVLDKETKFVVEEEKGFELTKVTVNDDEVVPDTNNTFTVSNDKDAKIKVNFKAIEQNLTLKQTGKGTVTLNGKTVLNGDGEEQCLLKTGNEETEKEITIVAEKGYTLTSIILNNDDILIKVTDNVIDLNEYTLNSKDNILTIVFEANKIALNDNVLKDNVYTINKSDIKSLSNEDLQNYLKNELINKGKSIPALADDIKNVEVKYLAGYSVSVSKGVEKVWQNIDTNSNTSGLIHSFGNKTSNVSEVLSEILENVGINDIKEWLNTETIYFEYNDNDNVIKSQEVTIKFQKIQSQFELQKGLSMPHSYVTSDLEEVLFNGIIYNENTILPEGLTSENFYYYYKCDVLAIISNELGIDLTKISDVKELSSILQLGYVSTGVSTVGGLNADIVSSISDLLGVDVETIKNIPLAPNVGTCDVKVTYEGNDDYSTCTAEGQVEITKNTTTSVKINSQTIKYGETPNELVTVSPKGVKTLIIYAGINGDAEGFVSIDLPNTVANDITESKLKGKTINDLNDILSDEFGIKSDALLQVIDKLPDNVKNSTITFAEQPKDAGVYVVGAITLDSNYETAYDIGTLAIAPDTASVELEFNSDLPELIPYKDIQENPENYDFSVKVNGVDSEEVNLKVTYVGTTATGDLKYSDSDPITEPGVYTQTAYILGGNYYAEPITRIYTVTREKSKIDVTTENKVYDGNSISITGVVKDSSDNAIENAEIEYSYRKTGTVKFIKGLPTDAGTYSVYALYKGDATHEVTATKVKVTISKADTSITVEEKITATYNEKEVTGIVTSVAPTFGPDSVKPDYIIQYFDKDGKELSSAPVNAGEYLYTATIKGTDNYNSSYANGRITINKAKTSIEVLNAEENTIETTYNGEKVEADVNILPKFSFEVPYTITYSDSNGKLESAPINAGEYTYTVTVTSTDNYEGSKVEGKIVINKVNTSIEVKETIEATYNAQEVLGVVTKVTPTTDPNNKALDYIIQYFDSDDKELSGAPINAGTYKYKATVTGSDNYNKSSAEGTIIINKCDVDITITNSSELEKTYDGSALEVKARVLPNYQALQVASIDDDTSKDESLNYTVTYYDENNNELDNAPVNAGTYTYIINVDETSNTNDVATEGTITINPRSIEVVVDNVTKTIDDDDPTFTYTLKGELASNDKIEDVISIERTSGEEIGTYDIKVTSKSSNYSITSNTATLTIKDYEVGDYSSVDSAISKVPTNLSAYTDESVANLQAALKAAENRNLKTNNQALINQLAQNILNAIDALVLKDVETEDSNQQLPNNPDNVSNSNSGVELDVPVQQLPNNDEEISEDDQNVEGILGNDYVNLETPEVGIEDATNSQNDSTTIQKDSSTGVEKENNKTKTADNTNISLYAALCGIALVVLRFITKNKKID